MVNEYFYMGLLTRIAKVVNPSLRMGSQSYILSIPFLNQNDLFVRTNITLKNIYEHEKDEYKHKNLTTMILS